MSELTLTIMRLGLLVALWLFVFSIVGVLRGDLYGTQITRRPVRETKGRGRKARNAIGAAGAVGAAGAGAASGAGAIGGFGAPAGSPAYGSDSGPHALPERGGFFGRGRSTTPRKLVVTEGPLAGTSLPLRAQGTLIGRSPECALVLDDDYASGRHARIYEESGTWVVEDLGSTNGTFVDNRRITAPQPLGLGSSLRIGRTVVELSR